MKKAFILFAFASFALSAFSGCSSTAGVKAGDTISIVYTATFSDGQLFDQNTEQSPLIFTVGSQQTLQGIDEGVIGMKVGKTKTITIKPDKGYGALYTDNNIQKVGKLIFDKIGIVPETGKSVKLDTITGIVKGFETDESGNVYVLFDINPRQTRDTLKYKITIIAKQ